MPLPIPNLDDRRFDDLVEEVRARLATHLPELTQIAPGDPAETMIDLFAYLTETILYRANLIPERQRRVVMNLLQIPIRNARPSKGVVCIDSSTRSVSFSSIVREGSQLGAGNKKFTAIGDVQPTPLSLSISIKKTVSENDLLSLGLTLQDLKEQYGIERGSRPQPFQPKTFETGHGVLSLTDSLDKKYYLALVVPKPLVPQIDKLRENLTGIIINIAIAPANDLEGEEVNSLQARQLQWDFMTKDDDGTLRVFPLEVVHDSSRGGRQTGVVRLRLPHNKQLFNSLSVDDPMFSGVGDYPPELPATIAQERVAAWLQLSCIDDPDLEIGYFGINGIDVLGQGLTQDAILGVGDGKPDQFFKLNDTLIDPESLVLQVETNGAWATWERVEFLVGHGGNASVYKLDAVNGVVYFGDGLEGGRRPPVGKRIRAARYLHGGGKISNVTAGEIKELINGSSRLTIRHEWPCKGGVDAETVSQAERRIPQFLTHRNRAVTKLDYKIVTENNPINPVAKAEVLNGFLPGATINAARNDVPGVVSVFVLPPGEPALRQTPKPTKGLLKDVFEYLLQRILIGTELYVLSPQYVPLAVSVNIDVIDAETMQETTQAVEKALINYLWPLPPGGAREEGWNMGVNVRGNELQTQIARVPGVRAVKALTIFRQGEQKWKRLARDEQIELARYQLPELVGVRVGSGDGEPQLPNGIEPSDDNGKQVPAPVIPEVC